MVVVVVATVVVVLVGELVGLGVGAVVGPGVFGSFGGLASLLFLNWLPLPFFARLPLSSLRLLQRQRLISVSEQGAELSEHVPGSACVVVVVPALLDWKDKLLGASGLKCQSNSNKRHSTHLWKY